MMQISPTQLATLSESTVSLFTHRVAKFLAEHISEFRNVSPAALCERAATQIGRAGSYGLTTEDEVASFVLATQFLGPDFDEHSSVGSYLTGPHSAIEKARFLDAVILATDQIARERYG